MVQHGGDESDRLAQRLHGVLSGAGVVDDLQRYFAEASEGDDFAGYSGRHFERLGGGGDRPDVASTITATDLLAVQTLSVSVPPAVAVHLLGGQLGTEVDLLLRQIPTDVDLGAGGAEEHLADGAAADRCWQLLNEQPGIGWVTAGKLLARKRPRLIPVFDEVVRCALGNPSNFWLSLHRAMQASDIGIASRLAELQCGVPQHVSRLRVLDVAVWMSHAEDHRQHR